MDFTGKTIAICAAGTGGHVYPALAVSESLIEMGARVIWFGSEKGVENKIVPKKGIRLYKIPMLGVRKNGLKRLTSFPFMVIKSYKKAANIIKREKVDLVFCFGGYICVPSGISAMTKRVPIIIHEQNVKMGLSNKLLAPFAKRVLLGLPLIPKKTGKYHLVGNPIRKEISDLKQINNKETPHILVIGGSLGAKCINESFIKAVRLIDKEATITHQTGDKTYKDTIKGYEKEVPGYKDLIDVKPYINNMASAYSNADIIISRAGALSVSEISSAGRCAIFIPLAIAVDDHQYHNANTLYKKGAAEIILEKNLTPRLLADNINNLINEKKYLAVASSAKRLSHESALNNCLKHTFEVING